MATAAKEWRAAHVLFVLHLWLGVLLGIYTVVIGLTGSALVFAPQIESGEPLRAAHLTLSTVALEPVLRRIAAIHPEEVVLGIDNLDRSDEPLLVYLNAERADKVRGEQRIVSISQPVGSAPSHIVQDRLRYAGFLGVCANLHIYLLTGAVGSIVNGVCACAFLLLCLTGWLLWWPGKGRIKAGLRVRWFARFKRLNWDLHTFTGFWSNPFLVAVIATGILFVFPRPILLTLSLLTGGSAQSVKSWLSSPQVSAPAVGQQTQSADAALARARTILRQKAEGYGVRYLAMPNSANAVFDAIAYPRGGAAYAMPIYLYLDARSLSIVAMRDARDLPAGMRWATYAYALHFGTFGGVLSRVLWVVLGLLPAGLWATGLLMWWNRGLRSSYGSSGRKKELSAEVSAVRAALP